MKGFVVVAVVAAILAAPVATQAQGLSLDLRLVAGAGPAMLSMDGEVRGGTLLTASIRGPSIDRLASSPQLGIKLLARGIRHLDLAAIQYQTSPIKGTVGLGAHANIANIKGLKAGTFWTSLRQLKRKPLDNLYLSYTLVGG